MAVASVLILVLMEDTLGVTVPLGEHGTVLILVLMEDTLGGKYLTVRDVLERLNPCFNGRYSRRNWVITNESENQ